MNPIGYMRSMLLALVSTFALFAHADNQTTEFLIKFPVNSSTIQPALFDNAHQINSAVEFLNNVTNDPRVEIVSVSFCGAASPEGPYELNKKLANERLKAVEKLVRDQVSIPDGKVRYDDAYIPWNTLRQQIMESDISGKDEIIAIIDGPSEFVSFDNATDRTIDSRIKKLQALNGGSAWKELNKRFFSNMRLAGAVIVTYTEPEPEPVPEPQPVVVPEPEPEPEVVVEEVVVEEVEEIAEEEPDDWYRKMYIKTNVPAWALLWQNLAVEFDLAKHWSFALPVYWSPYDYGKQTIKFRTLAFVPEFRYWVRPDNMGFFVNAHFGLAYYNYAKKGEFRYQDHDGKTPAIGGGVGLGYRFYFCKNHHWTMEAAVGAGVYRLDYDIFENTPVTKHGYLLGRRKRTFYGIDQAAFTISYSFGLRKKGGK